MTGFGTAATAVLEVSGRATSILAADGRSTAVTLLGVLISGAVVVMAVRAGRVAWRQVKVEEAEQAERERRERGDGDSDGPDSPDSA